MGDKNWLQTVGSWLVKPVSVIIAPWWEKHVEDKAEELAVRRKSVEAIIRFRMGDFARACSLDSDKAAGIAIKVVDHLKKRLADDLEIEFTSCQSLKIIESEIQFQGVPTSTWIQLACLFEIGEFDPRQYIIVEFKDEKGSFQHASAIINGLKASFPFFTKLIDVNAASFERSRLSLEARESLLEYCSRKQIPETRYITTNSLQSMNSRLPNNANILRYDWKPQQLQ